MTFSIHSAMVAVASDSGTFIGELLEAMDLHESWQIWLFFFGLLGQVVFFMRWVVQWIASERRGHSHMPEIFWWSSLIGALMLLIYFALRKEPIGVLGQLSGWAIYARNLYLVHKHRKAGEPVDTPDTSPFEDDGTGDVCPTCGRPTPVAT